jgi:N4-gp56 family major capsid protein
MAEFTWEGGVATGVLKNHALSAKLREAAIAQTKFLQFVDTEPGYGRKKGDSLTITGIKNIAAPTNAQLGERDRIPIDPYQQTSNTITVVEWGRGVEYTHLAELLAHYDLEDKIQRKLRQQLQLVLDAAAADAYKAAEIMFIPTSVTGGVFDTDGTPSTQALANVTVAHLKVIRDYLADTIHCPGWRGGDEFIGLMSTKACRGLRNDPEFVEAMKYAGSKEWFAKGEIGKIENIKIIEVNNTAALANNKGSGSVLGEGLVFGDESVVMAVAEDPELRAAIPADFGRQKAVAWYGVLAFKRVWASANDGEARIIRITSS